MAYSLATFYQSKAWVKLMQVIKAERLNDEGQIICEHCGKPIVRAYDCIGHHIKYLTEENVNNAEISLNPDNVMLVHHRCHNKIHNKLGYSGRKVYLVYGSPLSGKSEYVDEVKEDGDLIVNLDDIWECVSGRARYVKPQRLNAVAFGVRDYLLECVKYRRGKWMTAYIVGGYPLISERQRLCRELGAEEIYIDSTESECLKRLYSLDSKDARANEDWNKFIRDWWEKYSRVPPV